MNFLTGEKRALEDIRTAIADCCREALERVSGSRVSSEDVHEARKALKKARAWLRLLEAGTGSRAFRDHNRALRDAARPLSQGRDAQILIETLDGLIERYHEPANDRRFGSFRSALLKDRTATQRELMHSRDGLASSRRALRGIVATLPQMGLRGQSWDVIGSSFEKVYARGVKSLRASREDLKPESLHEWRKDAKYLRHALQMLEPLWPGVVGEWGDQAHQLGEYLGDDHDLWVLRQAVKAKPKAFRAAGERDALLALIDRRRTQLEEKALLLGARLYEPKPKRLRTRLGKYWELWADTSSRG